MRLSYPPDKKGRGTWSFDTYEVPKRLGWLDTGTYDVQVDVRFFKKAGPKAYKLLDHAEILADPLVKIPPKR
jgi:hypothetical protein